MSDETLESGYPGVGRLYYFLGRVMLVIVTIFSAVYFGPGSTAFQIVTLATMIAGAVLDVMRLKNIGVAAVHKISALRRSRPVDRPANRPNRLDRNQTPRQAGLGHPRHPRGPDRPGTLPHKPRPGVDVDSGDTAVLTRPPGP
jgi:hypothetical protein